MAIPLLALGAGLAIRVAVPIITRAISPVVTKVAPKILPRIAQVVPKILPRAGQILTKPAVQLGIGVATLLPAIIPKKTPQPFTSLPSPVLPSGIPLPQPTRNVVVTPTRSGLRSTGVSESFISPKISIPSVKKMAFPISQLGQFLGQAGLALGAGTGGLRGKSTVVAVGRRYILRQRADGTLSVSSRIPRRRFAPRARASKMDKLVELALITSLMRGR